MTYSSAAAEDRHLAEPTAIFFDIGNTLIAADSVAAGALEVASEWLAQRMASVDQRRVVERLIQSQQRQYDLKTNKLWGLPMDDWRDLADDLSIPEALALQGSAVYRSAVRSQFRVDADVVHALAHLREMGITLGIISDGTEVEQLDTLHMLGLTEMFTIVVISESAGYAKPDPRLFAVAQSKLGTEVAPGELWYVGDDFERDYLGARACGWSSVLVDPRGDYSHDSMVQRIENVPQILRILEAAR